MLLKKLIENIEDISTSRPLEELEIKGLACDSRKVLPGYLYIAIKGRSHDGQNFINEAIKNGAISLFVDKSFKISNDIKIPTIFSSDTHRALIDLANKFYNWPSQKLKIIGVTGTNGKTTVTYLLEKILQAAGFSVGVIGTVNYRFKEKKITASNTTPGPLELQALLDQMSKEKINYVVMEVSSHALDQDRTAGINFKTAIFTNLTQDHLDYHKNLEDYFHCKAKLFKNLAKNATSVINSDDRWADKLIKEISSKVVTYGINKPCNVKAQDIKFSLDKTEFLVKIDKKQELTISTKLIGIHNIYNILASIACMFAEGIKLDFIKKGIEDLDNVPGRLEKIDCGQDFKIFVDYAHTPDALFNVLGSLKKIFNKKIMLIFGAGGDRDKDKRPKMGKVASDVADYVILTSDNPRSEDPLNIAQEIAQGIRGNNYEIIIDRKEAIKKTLSRVDSNWIVLVAGKGHETYQVIKDKTIPFSDQEEIKQCLASKKYCRQHAEV